MVSEELAPRLRPLRTGACRLTFKSRGAREMKEWTDLSTCAWAKSWGDRLNDTRRRNLTHRSLKYVGR